jgi:hypothetical protein
MRCLIASLTVAVAALTVSPAVAQAPPPDSVAQVFRQKVAPGMVDKYEAGRKKHMAWHKAQGDPWTWSTYEVTTGPDTGSYLISSINHQWADFDKFGDGDTADANVSMAGTQAGSQMAYWTQLSSLSRLPPAGAPPAPLLSLTVYGVKPGHDAALTAAIGKLNAALNAGKFPLHSIWYRLTNGGSTPSYAVVTPRANMASFDIAILAALEKQLGKAGTDALVKEFFDNVNTVSTELLQRRADLSYAPN